MAAIQGQCAKTHLQSKAFLGDAGFAGARRAPVLQRGSLQIFNASGKALRDRINSVKNTQKITDAMKLVAAAKVRRAQDAVVNGRPFSENLVKVLFGVNQRLRVEDVDSPLVQIRPVETILLAVISGDRGLCGGYNNQVIKKAEKRAAEVKKMGLKAKIVLIGKKGITYFNRRTDQYDIVGRFELGQAPTTKEAQAIADSLYSEFVGLDVDKVELIYTKFVSLISSDPIIQTLLPLTPQAGHNGCFYCNKPGHKLGHNHRKCFRMRIEDENRDFRRGEICDIDGTCVDAADDEIFKLTTKEGSLSMEREKVKTDTSDFDSSLIFEQDPVQIIDALLPLYLNSTLLRALQESLACELAARMNAMSSASDNAKDLKKKLNLKYNRQRQAAITGQIIEICSGSAA